ncbi:hypothetical protein AVEN_176837-1, partial [Araneus ventricosus]
MSRVFVVALLLLYFWYMFQLDTTPNLSQPSSPAPTIPSTKTFTHHFQKIGNILQLNVDSVGKLTMQIPPTFTFQNNRLVSQDVCHNQPDGARILASGRVLYDYMRRDLFERPDRHTDFEPNSSRLLQHGDSFYFVCKNESIFRLHQCPPGQVFRDGQCSKIDACTGRPKGFLLPDPFDETAYYECQGVGLASLHQKCPTNHWFMFDACRPQDDDAYYCQFYNEPRRIDDTTFLKCDPDKRPRYFSCPPGTRLFDKVECESDACVGQQDGTKLPMELERNKPFKYIPGYLLCENEKVARHVLCDKTWDHYVSDKENLTHLPLVFDGNNCTFPKLCDNVQYIYADTIVPVFEFSRRVRNWEWAEYYDRLSGYTCPSSEFKTAKKRVSLEPGTIINPKKFKPESACTSGVKTVPIAEHWDLFHNCDDGYQYKCSEGEYFDGFECKKSIENAHTFNGYPMFRLKPFSVDGWILPFQYG